MCVLVSSLKVKMLMSIGDEARNKMPLGHNVMDPGIRLLLSHFCHLITMTVGKL